MSELINKTELKKLRQRLRNNAPSTEQKLWFYLKGKQLSGVKFRRQVSIGNYIVDFYSFDKKLVIEVDGDSHFENTKSIEKDKTRDEFLNSKGIKVLRFSNQEVFKNIDGVLLKVLDSFSI